MRYIRLAFLVIAAVVLAGVLAQPARADVSFDVSFSNLNQHGSWLVSAQYGHVWQPREYNREWNPYYDGHWVDTDMGWAWVSDYEWGAIPYHYGTWYADPEAGWVWVPGSVWAPSWVVFRTDSDYIGWAPVPPGFSVGMAVNLGGASSFVFVSSHDFLAPRIRASIIPMDRSSLFINNTTVVNNIVVQNNVVINRGPDVRIIEKATGRTIRQEPIESVTRVAPFDHVSRAQLAMAPERAKQGVRVAEPVPASRPLPVADQRGIPQQRTSPADPSKPLNALPVARPNAQKPATPAAAGMPSGATDSAQKARNNASAEQNASAQRNANAKATESANAQRNANAKATQSASALRSARANAEQSASAQRNANAKTTQSANAQANANAKAGQSANAQANANAKADQVAKAQPKAKAKPDAKAKKDNQDKKDQSSDKGTTPEPKEGSQQ